MTLSKLSLRNAKRQAKDYLVYFVTVVMSAALIYAFNDLVFSKELLQLSVRMEYLPEMIVFASIIVVCIIGWLVYYTTGFMLTKRSRELGTYILIGLEPKQVTRLFMMENLLIGTAAFVLGTILGSFLFQINPLRLTLPFRAVLFSESSRSDTHIFYADLSFCPAKMPEAHPFHENL